MSENANSSRSRYPNYNEGVNFRDADFTALLRRLPPVHLLGRAYNPVARTARPVRVHRMACCPGCHHQVELCDRAIEADFPRQDPRVVAALHDIVMCWHCRELQFVLPGLPVLDNVFGLADYLTKLGEFIGHTGFDIRTRAWALVLADDTRLVIDYFQRVHVLHPDGAGEHRELDLDSDVEKGLRWYGDTLHRHNVTFDL